MSSFQTNQTGQYCFEVLFVKINKAEVTVFIDVTTKLIVLDYCSLKKKIMSGARLNKELWIEVGKLKNLNANSDPKFIVDKTPFDDLDEDEDVQAASAVGKEYVILGKIIPNSNIYKEGAYQIEMKLTSTFPIEPPTIRFITKIYHPNVSTEGSIR